MRIQHPASMIRGSGTVSGFIFGSHLRVYAYLYICGCFLKRWYPPNTPKWSFLVGKPMVVGYHHFRKHPCMFLQEYFYFRAVKTLKGEYLCNAGLDIFGGHLGMSKVYQTKTSLEIHKETSTIKKPEVPFHLLWCWNKNSYTYIYIC